MSAIVEITSLQNSRIKEVVKLRDRKFREEKQKILVEGYRAVHRALERGFQFEEFYFSESFFLGTNEKSLIKKIGEQGAGLFSVAEHVFPKICYRDRPEGLVGVLPYFETSIEKLSLEGKHMPLFLVVEAIEKPGNLGTMLRTADAVGVNGLIICNRCTDIFNPNVIRASTGAIFSVPIVETSSEEALKWLREKNVASIAADPYASKNCYMQNLNQPLALILGAEQVGLSRLWKEKADSLVNIPMLGMADSLNVAQAATVLLFEARRQQL